MGSSHTEKTTGTVLDDGMLIEIVHDAVHKRTALVRYRDGMWTEESVIKRSNAPDLEAYSALNPLLMNKIVQFPSKVAAYESDAHLVAEVTEFIHRYVDVTETFESIAAHYVLFSWVFDAFNELLYLRVRGDYGTGKTRFLTVVGSIAYKPIFGSGASTVSPMFHLLDKFNGTLVIDEADFRFSDEKADLVKILNNGNVRGFPVLRTMVERNGEFSPRAFQVYGPKIIASRGEYEDRALESRFITEDMGVRPLRRDVPINLPAGWEDEAVALRNKLLMYRFRKRGTVKVRQELVDWSVEARINQILVPLLSVIDDANVRKAVMHYARRHHEERQRERAASVEAHIVTVLRRLFRNVSGVGVAVGDVASLFHAHYGGDTPSPMTARLVGEVIRSKLRLRTRKSNGRFVVPMDEREKLMRLCEKYGVTDDDVAVFGTQQSEGRDQDDVGDMGMSGTLR
jgi:hypothetical protein